MTRAEGCGFFTEKREVRDFLKLHEINDDYFEFLLHLSATRFFTRFRTPDVSDRCFNSARNENAKIFVR